jgi:hypothetical protein
MEALTRMVADSLARHGLDRPIDPRRLQWSRWFRCDSTHSLLVVPSKPGIFALAEEIMDLGTGNTHVGTAANAGTSKTSVGADALVRPAEQSSAAASSATTAETTAEGISIAATHGLLGGAALQRCDSTPLKTAASAAEVPQRRLLAVLQFSEDDDMAFTLDRMFTRINPMRDRLASGRCFLRFVVIEDQAQRRSICSALNQWMLSASEKASGLPADFSSTLEMTTDRVARTLPSTSSEPALSLSKGQALSDSAKTIPTPAAPPQPAGNKTNVVTMPRVPGSGAAKNLHCPHPLPSGF